MIAAGSKICHAGLELPAGARNRRKANVKMRRNPIHHETDEVQMFYTNSNKIHNINCSHGVTLILYYISSQKHHFYKTLIQMHL